MEADSEAGGYVTDLTYAESFFRELSPAWLNYVAALNGISVCDLSTPFNYLELGCGQGQTALINAAAFPHANIHACDVNPTHIAAARHRAAEFAIDNAHFHEASFAELLRSELPSFDFIVLHGVYSWVDSEARQTVRAILANKLRSGGLAYVSYNCLPGWASEAPLRKLLVELAATQTGDSGQRSAHALHALLQLSACKLQFLTANPGASSALSTYQHDPLNYLVHEFMNRSWDPFYGVDLADELQASGLEFIGSATLAENHPMLLLDERTATAIASLGTDRQRRLATDFATNQRFRRDVFVRGTSPRATARVAPQLANSLLGCVHLRDLTKPSIRVPRGELTLQSDFMRELAEVLRHGPVSIAQAVSLLHRPGRDTAGIVRNLLFLTAGGTLQPCATRAPTASDQPLQYATPTTRHILNHSIDNGVSAIVPSTVLGNGLRIQALEALAVSGYVAGHNDAAALAAWLEPAMARHQLTLNQGVSMPEFVQQVLDELLPTLIHCTILR